MHTRIAKRKNTAPSRADLERRAEELDIRFNDRWSDEALIRNIKINEGEL